MLSSSAPAPFVYLDSHNYAGVFSDNGFLMDSAKPVAMSFMTDASSVNVQIFQDGLAIR